MADSHTTIRRKLRGGPVLVVAGDRHVMSSLRQSLASLGFESISGAANHGQALDRVRTRTFPLILFEAGDTNLPTRDFVLAVRRLDEESTLIALSAAPRIDDVFELLKVGARSFLVTPFTTVTLEEVVSRAVLGPPFSDVILDASDRDAALAALVLNNLYRLATAMRHARAFSTFGGHVQAYRAALHESSELARLFSLGGDAVLREKLVEACILRAQTAATRLGRTRLRLKRQRGQGGPEIPRVGGEGEGD